MGEAKRRGTYEQRKAAAIKRDKKIMEKRKLIEKDQKSTMIFKGKETKPVIQFVSMLSVLANKSIVKSRLRR